MWKPSCTIDMIKARAEMYAQIRAFFHQRKIMEVETPLLGISTATDPQLDSLGVELRLQPDQASNQFYLQTSPEFPMKRLLASGSGAIYQLCKTFRNGETGKRHNPEFSMLEWYRPGFSLEELMDEMTDLIRLILGPLITSKLSYQDAFFNYLSLDPFTVSDQYLADKAKQLTNYNGPKLARDDYLNLLLSHCIEPHLGPSQEDKISLVFLLDYPPSQASLAQLKTNDHGVEVAERFELYIDGLELANGYFELTNAEEQSLRFQKDNRDRLMLGLPEIPLDQNFLSAMKSGLPVCSGVALGLDRLLMIKEKAQSISDVLTFPIDRA